MKWGQFIANRRETVREIGGARGNLGGKSPLLVKIVLKSVALNLRTASLPALSSGEHDKGKTKTQ